MPIEGIDDFRRAAEALAGAEKTVLSEVSKNMRAAAKPVVNAIRAEVRSSKGSSPKGQRSGAAYVERQLQVLSKARSLRDEEGALSERRVRALTRRLAKSSSLREQIAAAAGSSVSAGGRKVQLSFRVRAGNLPPSQRKLPRRWDKPGGWRHPVFGNRSVWVPQVGHPYFGSTIVKSKDQVAAAVVTAMTAAAEKITHPGEGSA